MQPLHLQRAEDDLLDRVVGQQLGRQQLAVAGSVSPLTQYFRSVTTASAGMPKSRDRRQRARRHRIGHARLGQDVDQ